MRLLITGCAGFIGYHLCLKILENSKNRVYGIDDLNKYYDIRLKKDRLNKLIKYTKRFHFYKIDISNFEKLKNNFSKNKYDYVINLAAQAGVRHSIRNPSEYLKSNVVGFFNILEVSRIYKIKHLIFASTSSVYGSSKKFPLKEKENTDKPLSFYAATKKSNEVMAYSYSNIYNLRCTGLRFFTIYGPYGRPDMSLFKFSKSIFESKKIDLFNKGNHIRDFTYIDDAILAILKIIPKPSRKKIPFSIYNIANSKPENLKMFLRTIEKNIGIKSKKNLMKLQLGDIYKTHGSIQKLYKKINYKPKTKISIGIKRFVEWYREYYRVDKKL